MALKIRLTRKGTNKVPLYRVVVQESRTPRDGKFVEIIGTYNPKKADDKAKLTLKKERYNYWYEKGARPTKTLSEMIKRQG